tara:strand:- start:22381 stop:23520 length:1140 start_codon:yes stop_codon:yes gene_type:complete
MVATNFRLIRDIEVLRAVAVLGVILQHMNGNLFPKLAASQGLPSVFYGGWAGVDLFFCISGFVIARSFLPRAMNPSHEEPYRYLAFRFWVSRLFRLAPSAWFWLLVILALCVGYNRSGVFGTLETNLWWTISGIFNFSNYLFVQYFGVAKPGVSFVYWSLSLEEQFYLLFPIVVWLFKRRLVWFLVAVVLVQLFQERGLYQMMFRTDAIALGVLLAMTHSATAGVLTRLRGICNGWLACGLVLCLIAALFYIGSFRQVEMPLQVGLVALVSAVLVWLCSGAEVVVCRGGFFGQSLLWIGKRSYAMYLIHIPVLFFIRESAFRADVSLAEHPLIASMLALLMIFLLAAANYRWLEAPLRARGKSIAAGIGNKQRHPQRSN